jgi:hypothetical protein
MFYRVEFIRGPTMGMPLGWHRRHAITLASQLPDNPADALLVLQAAKELVETFLVGFGDGDQPRAANVLPFEAKA